MTQGFVKAVRSRRKLRAALDGPSGGGKSFSALRLAFAMIARGMGSRVAVIDTENESASLYAGEAPDGVPWEYDTLNLKSYGPDSYTGAMNLAFKSGFDILLIDSLSHAWTGEGGALDLVDKKGGNRFTGWKDVTPLHRRMVDTIINAPIHVIVTMRSKTEYVLETDERGKSVPRRIGVAPIQREGMEYEFDVYGSLDWTHQIRVTKSRCRPMDGATAVNPGPMFWAPLFDWLESGAASSARGFAEQAAAVTPDQLGQLADIQRALFAARGLSDPAAQSAAWAEWLVPFGVGSAKQLTRDKAGEFIAKLEAELANSPAVVVTPVADVTPAVETPPPMSPVTVAVQATVDAAMPPAAPVVESPPTTTPPPPAPKVTDSQLSEIATIQRLFFASLPGGSTEDEKRAEWVKLVAGYGVASARDFTADQAAAFIATEGPRHDPFTHGPSGGSKT